MVPVGDGEDLREPRPGVQGRAPGPLQDSDERDAQAAANAAAEAFRSGRLVAGPQRGETLFRFAEIISRRKEEFSRDTAREMGKVAKEARGDVQEASDMACLMGGEGRRRHGATTPSELPDKFAMAVDSPLGVCAFITPWNFPMAIPAWKATAARICGNTIVIKPATDTLELAVDGASWAPSARAAGAGRPPRGPSSTGGSTRSSSGCSPSAPRPARWAAAQRPASTWVPRSTRTG